MNDPVERANRFYIEMSRKILSKNEYDVLHNLLIDKMSLAQAAEKYGVTAEYVQELYESTCNEVKVLIYQHFLDFVKKNH